MKSFSKTKILFLLFSLFALFYIYNNSSRIDTNIYSIMADENLKEINLALNDKLRDDFSILSDKPEIFTELKNLNNGVLENKENENFLEILDELKLASLEYEKYINIKKNFDDFLEVSSTSALNPFAFRVINLQNDLLNISSLSSFLNVAKNFKFDASLNLNFINYHGKIYYIKTLKIKNHSGLIELTNKLSKISKSLNATTLIHSPALYAQKGKENGNLQSIFMSVCSIILLGIFIFIAFGKWQILNALSVIAFSFLSGLCAAFLFFDNIHILSIVVSTSLAGLVLDFAMHWLGEQHNKTIEKSSIKNMKKIFLLTLLISSSGYAIFLLSFMPLLSQIAVISIFTLLGAFLSSYFLLPELLDGKVFKAKRVFRIFIFYVILALKFIQKKQVYFIFFVLIFIAYGGYLLANKSFNDNIKNYMIQPKELLEQSTQFIKITNFQNYSEILVLNKTSIQKQRELIDKLKDKNLITDYNGISKYFLSFQEQNDFKNFLLNNTEKISNYYSFLDKDDIIKSLENLKAKDIKNNKNFSLLPNVFSSKEKDFIFIQNSQKNKEFFDIISSYNAKFYDMLSSINTYFTKLKIKTIYLKIFSYLLAFFILWYFLNFKKALIFILLLVFSSIFSLAILAIFNVDLNIFCIFGLILANAVGMDYLIIATNTAISRYRRILGILLAFVTSFISFFLLAFSNITAVSSFGLSVNICMLSTAILAMLLSLKTQNIKFGSV